MRKKTKLTEEAKKYILEHYKVDTIEKMSKDLNFDTKVLRSYVEELDKISKPDESENIRKQKKHVTIMTKGKAQAVDDHIKSVNESEVKVDPKRIFMRPD